MGAAGKFEVVVEAVTDGRTNRVVGTGPQPGDRLSHQVSRGMTQDITTVLAGWSDNRHRGPLGKRCGEVGELAVHFGRESIFGES